MEENKGDDVLNVGDYDGCTSELTKKDVDIVPKQMIYDTKKDETTFTYFKNNKLFGIKKKGSYNRSLSKDLMIDNIKRLIKEGYNEEHIQE